MSETKQIEIEFLYVDIERWGRCKGTEVNLTTALQMAQSLLDAADTGVIVRKTLVDSEQLAIELGLISSPSFGSMAGTLTWICAKATARIAQKSVGAAKTSLAVYGATRDRTTRSAGANPAQCDHVGGLCTITVGLRAPESVKQPPQILCGKTGEHKRLLRP